MNRGSILDKLKQLQTENEGDFEYEKLGRNKVWCVDHNESKEWEIDLSEKTNFRKMVFFNRLPIDKEKMFALVRKIPLEYFMIVKKIIFIYSENQYEKMVDELGGYEFLDLDHELGKYLFFEDYVIINMNAIIKRSRWLEENQTDPNFELNVQINYGIWTTLLHELRHSYQRNPVFEVDYEDIEEDAEEEGLILFENFIENEDFIIYDQKE
jgi:hypothetical protein